MKITSFFCKLEVEHLDAPIDPDRIALQGETIVIGIMTPLV